MLRSLRDDDLRAPRHDVARLFIYCHDMPRLYARRMLVLCLID